MNLLEFDELLLDDIELSVAAALSPFSSSSSEESVKITEIIIIRISRL